MKTYTSVHSRKLCRFCPFLEAVCMQHENDHLDGVLFIDRISRLKRSLYVKKRKKQLAAEEAE